MLWRFAGTPFLGKAVSGVCIFVRAADFTRRIFKNRALCFKRTPRTEKREEKRKIEGDLISSSELIQQFKAAMARIAAVAQFQRHLDPAAHEFWPGRRMIFAHQFNFPQPPHVYYYPYTHIYLGIPATENFGVDAGVPPVSPSPEPPLGMSTRALLLISVPADVTESIVRRDLGVFGEVRKVQMERLSEGIVTVDFFDLRHAESAMAAIQQQHRQPQPQPQSNMIRVYYGGLLFPYLCHTGPSTGVRAPAPGLVAGRTVWALFAPPATANDPEGENQGMIVILNVDDNVSSNRMREIFGGFGPMRELREAPLKHKRWFIEYFDIRDAARALSELNGKQIFIGSRKIRIKFCDAECRRKTNPIVLAPTNPSAAISTALGDSTTTPAGRGTTTAPASRGATTAPAASDRGRGNNIIKAPKNFGHTTHPRFSPTYQWKPNSNPGGPNYDGASSSPPGATTTGRTWQRVGSGINRPHNQYPYQPSRPRPWRSSDARFLVNVDAIDESSRTTLMIKNIPNRYSRDLLINILDNHCILSNTKIKGSNQPLSSYDFFYLPIDFSNKCNVGYAFVNLTSPQAARRLFHAFHSHHWEIFESKKICEVAYARLQGLEMLKEHFKNSRFPCTTEEYLPVMFSPPRDGKNAAPPIPISGFMIINSTHSSDRGSSNGDNGGRHIVEEGDDNT
ncbi:protein terminal ear1 homolog [Malania oleifera]|uniref:protein terminal ear1 homolog n=1 Tax=Malania oleifera TaxID=397392 RepID=UPI0025ADE1CB|nr:protein terminal ear1 homolog [Malania oleifera]